MIKRALDICVAGILLLPALPLIFLLVMAVRRESIGPGIFSQVRVGRDEKPFRCLKIRTMYADTAEVPSHENQAGAITPLGRALRKFKLDELPQLLNVLKGEMSLVGPRPCLPTQSELIERRREAGIFALRPGVTGLGQVNGVDMSDPDRLVWYESKYLGSMGIRSDLKIIYRTFAKSALQDRVGA